MTQERINYEEIREKKIKEYGTEFKDWIWILVKQYKDRTHFLFELLQNAEDEGAQNVRLLLDATGFTIEHDGTLFNRDDVVSITKVAKSTKNGPESGSIGKFGIGFKSVYAYTTVPRIYSGNYAFEIQDFIFPYEINNKRIKDNFTRIEIPFNSVEVQPNKAFLEIARALNEQITETTLLFLNNIQHIEINVDGHSNIIEISKEEQFLDRHHNFIDVNLLYQRFDKQSGYASNEVSSDYLVITDNEKEAVKIAFKVRKDKDSRELLPVRNTNVYTFFPTDKESHQSFYIHAPFDTTPARDNIVEDSERNEAFINNICSLIHGGYCWLRDNGYLTISGLSSTYPIYEYPENTIFRAIYDEAIAIIESDEVILPTNHSNLFKKRSEIIIPENMRIVDVFPDEDMQSVFQNRKMFWLAKEISTDACQPFREFLKKQFKFKTYAWPEIIRKLREETRFLELKERSWFIEFFNAINGVSISNEVKLSEIPLVRLSNGKHICAYSGAVPNVYLNNPEEAENKIDSFFLQDVTIKSFYAHNLRIPNYDIARIVIDEIIPKYSNRTRIEFTTSNHIHENIQDLKAVKMALSAEPSLAARLKDCYILTDGTNWYKPEDIHVSEAFGIKAEYALVKDICKLVFISPEYTSDLKIGNEKFFKDLGCPTTLKKERISKSQYLSYVRKYISHEVEDDIRRRIFSKEYLDCPSNFEWDTVYQGFPQVFDNITPEKSYKIAAFLNKSRANFGISGEVYAADDKGFSGKSADSMTIYSAMGLFISNIPWVYTRDGVKVAINSVHRRDLSPEYEKHMPLLIKILPFKEEDQAVEEILSRVENAQQREVLKSLLTDPDKLQEYTKAVQKQQLKEIKKNKSPKELLDELNSKKGGNVSNKEAQPDPEAVSNVENRTKKLEQEFAETMDQKTTLKLFTLKYTYQDKIDPAEKTFLQQMYNGYCQICGEHIEKYDATNYFEAINVLKTASLDEKYKETLGLGWNSLCLCPNCAAKYKYGYKDLSDFDTQVDSIEVESGEEEYIYIPIGLQSENVSIKYAPKHFLALQTALRLFRDGK